MSDSSCFYSLMVHVVTHADCQVVLVYTNGKTALARPHYNKFNMLCCSLYESMKDDSSGLVVVSFPSSLWRESPVGLRFAMPRAIGTMADWRIRSRDCHTDDDCDSDAAMVSEVYFPLLSVVLPLWLHLCSPTALETVVPVQDPNDLGPTTPFATVSGREHFVYLLTGSTMPRTPPHDCVENSTKYLALLMELFVSQCFSSVQSSTVDSGDGGLFSFHANVRFVQTVLTPLLAAKRRKVANMLGEAWPMHFSLMLSLKSDTAARTSALMAGLRQMRPDYLHISEMQSFWYAYPDIDALWEQDVEFLSFDQVEHSPASSVSQLEPDLRCLVNEMVRHKLAFEHAMRHNHEQRRFWLRKTQKPVLSVLMVQKDGLPPSFFTGINIEVSMPTGSLCAERNAIGSCLATDPSIHRRDMIAMAVLSMVLPEENHLTSLPTTQSASEKDSSSSLTSTLSSNSEIDAFMDSRSQLRRTRMQVLVNEEPVPVQQRAQNPINPCGACREWLKKIAICNPDFRVLTFRSMQCDEVYVRPVLR